MQSTILKTCHVSFAYKHSESLILNDVNFQVKKGAFVGIVGPNGSGKTSLIRCMYQSLLPTSGRILLNDQCLTDYTRNEIASEIAVVLQEQVLEIGLTVESILMLGRIPQRRMFHRHQTQLTQYECNVIERLSLAHLMGRSYSDLSGGEKKRTMIARALFQQPSILILDEPTNHLDIAHQISLLKFVSELDITVICSLHDLSLAADYCDDIAVMHHGKMIKQGPPEAVLESHLIQDVFRVHSVHDQHPVRGTLRLSFY
jgi:iron complex transport system ATP-binding protein